MTATYALLWTDSRGQAHVRVMTGTAGDAQSALRLLGEKYERGEGFLAPRMVALPGTPVRLADITAEVSDWRDGLDGRDDR
jgi:hypothetical protein